MTDKPLNADLELLTVKEVERLTKISRTTLFRMAEVGTFPHAINLGHRTTMYSRADIANWVEGLRNSNLEEDIKLVEMATELWLDPDSPRVPRDTDEQRKLADKLDPRKTK